MPEPSRLTSLETRASLTVTALTPAPLTVMLSLLDPGSWSSTHAGVRGVRVGHADASVFLRSESSGNPPVLPLGVYRYRRGGHPARFAQGKGGSGRLRLPLEP